MISFFYSTSSLVGVLLVIENYHYIDLVQIFLVDQVQNFVVDLVYHNHFSCGNVLGIRDCSLGTSANVSNSNLHVFWYCVQRTDCLDFIQNHIFGQIQL